MMPSKEFEAALGVAVVLLGLSAFVIFFPTQHVPVPASVNGPSVAGATSRMPFYPPVHIEVPATSIFAQTSPY